MKIPFISNYIDKSARQQVRKLMGNYFPSDWADKKNWWNEENYAPETKADFALAYERHIWTCACVSKIAQNAASIPIKLYAKGTENEITSGWLYDLLNSPNPETSIHDFIESFFVYSELTGDSFIELNDPNTPTMMKILRSYAMDVHYNSYTKQYEYRYKPSGIPEVIFSNGEILHFKYFHPNSDLYGFTPLQTVSADIVIDKNCTKYTQDFFSKGGMINLYLTVKENLQDFEHKRLKQEVSTNLTGLKNAHNIPVVDNGAEFKQAGSAINEIFLKSTKDEVRNEILAAMGVPPILFGFLAGLETYNNSQIQLQAFWESTMSPKILKLQSFLNRVLFNKHNAEVYFDLSVVPALKIAKQSQAVALSTLKTAGILTVNEVRSELDYEPIEGGDILQTQAAPVALSLSAPSVPIKKKLYR